MERHKDYYTSKETAKILSVATSTIQLWTKNGTLAAKTTAGGHRRISRQSIEKMLLQQSQLSVTHSLSDNLKILVIEDNQQMVRLYQQSINAWQKPIDLYIAYNGYDGLLSIGHTVPDIIITDLLMPTMDGFEMLRAIAEKPALDKCHIFIVTGLTLDEIAYYDTLPNNVHLFIKPINFTLLLKFIEFELALFRE